VALASTRGAEATGPTLGQLRAFVELAEELHFGRTARRLGVSQSSLSETIRRLEDHLGSVLLERTTRRVTLTEAGADLLPRAWDVLERVESMRSEGTGTSPSSDVFRIVVCANGFAELTQPILAVFRLRHPGVRVVLRGFSEALEDFVDGRFDVGLIRGPFAGEHIVVHDLATEPRGVIVSCDHPRAGAEGASILDFLDEPFLAAAPSVPSLRDYWLAIDQRNGEAPRIGGEAWSPAEVLHGITDLGLVTTGGRSIMRSFPVPGIAFVGVTDLPPVPMALAVQEGDERPLVRDFVEVARDVVGRSAHAAPGVWPLSPA
jgi:DNA-binding transcriptional LysR family regulator